MCRSVEQPRRKSENCRTTLKRHLVEKRVEHAQKELERLEFLTKSTASRTARGISTAIFRPTDRNLWMDSPVPKITPARGWLTLSAGDAQTILLALTENGTACFKAYDSDPDMSTEPGSVTFPLAEHIGRILAEIGHLGENLSAESADSRRFENPNAEIEELPASLLDTTTNSTGRENSWSGIATQKPAASQSWGRRILALISSCFRNWIASSP